MKNIQWRKSNKFSISAVEKLNRYKQKNETKPLFYTIHKNEFETQLKT